MNTTQADKAGHDYWDQNWDRSELPGTFDPTDKSLNNTQFARFHEYFNKLINGRKQLRVLEIGCAHSVWPHYFQTYHQAEVDGIDYSEVGCRKTRLLWDRLGVKGQIECADIFAPPANLLGQYDLVVSFGVMEHFGDTAAALRAGAAFLKPDGRMVTFIPNMSGGMGWLQKMLNREVYDIHVPLSASDLRQAQDRAGLVTASCHYFLSVNLNIVNAGTRFTGWKDQFVRRCLSIPSKLVWLFERSGLRLPALRWTSPYVVAVATKSPRA